MFDKFFSPEILEAVVWTFIHSIWQAGIFSVVAYLSSLLLKKALSKFRYFTNLTLLFLLLVTVLVTFLSQLRVIHDSRNHTLQPSANVIEPSQLFDSEKRLIINPESVTTSELSENLLTSFYSKLSFIVTNNRKLIIQFWVLGVFFLSFYSSFGWFGVNRVKKQSIPIDQAHPIYEILKELTKKLKITRAINVALSDKVSSPCVVGLFKVVILFPSSIFTHLTTEELEMILLHELGHIKRYDFLMNILQTFAEVILFFNPFVWTLSKRIRDERENACDDIVIQYGDMLNYARLLTDISAKSIEGKALGMALWKRKGQLMNRITRMINAKTILSESSANQKKTSNVVTSATLSVLAIFILSSFQIAENNNENLDKTIYHIVNVPEILQDNIGKKHRIFALYPKAFEMVETDLSIEEIKDDRFKGEHIPLDSILNNPNLGYDTTRIVQIGIEINGNIGFSNFFMRNSEFSKKMKQLHLDIIKKNPGYKNIDEICLIEVVPNFIYLEDSVEIAFKKYQFDMFLFRLTKREMELAREAELSRDEEYHSVMMDDNRKHMLPFELEEKTILYPKYVAEKVRVYSKFKIEELTVINVLGEIMLTQQKKNAVDVKNFKEGSYTMVIKTDSNRVFIKQFYKYN